MVPNHIQRQFLRHGKVVVSEMPPRVVSIIPEQACAILYAAVKSDRIFAQIATYSDFQVNSEDMNSARFLAPFIKQQVIDSIKMVIPVNGAGYSFQTP